MTVRPMAGTAPTITARIRDVDGDLADPTTVAFTVLAPDDTQATYTYGVDAEVVKEATGVYSLTTVFADPGRWVVHVATTGALIVTEELAVAVRAAEVTP